MDGADVNARLGSLFVDPERVFGPHAATSQVSQCPPPMGLSITLGLVIGLAGMAIPVEYCGPGSPVFSVNPGRHQDSVLPSPRSESHSRPALPRHEPGLFRTGSQVECLGICYSRAKIHTGIWRAIGARGKTALVGAISAWGKAHGAWRGIRIATKGVAGAHPGIGAPACAIAIARRAAAEKADARRGGHIWSGIVVRAVWVDLINRLGGHVE